MSGVVKAGKTVRGDGEREGNVRITDSALVLRICNVRIEFLAPLHHNNFVALEVQCVLNFHMVLYVQELPFYTAHLCRLLGCGCFGQRKTWSGGGRKRRRRS